MNCTAHQASLSITNSWSLPKLMSVESVMPSNHLILCHPLLLLPPAPPNIMIFSNESALCVRWPKYLSFSFDISSSSEYQGLISFRIDWLDLLAVQWTLENLLFSNTAVQSINSSALSFLYSPTLTSIHDHWKNQWFNMLSRLVITFLPRNKHLLISWLQSPSAVIFGAPQKTKVCHCFHYFPIYLP